jgi:Uma2 family endonuclease
MRFQDVLDYPAAGAPRVWVVDPRMRLITVHQGTQRTRLRDDDRLAGADVLPGLEIDVREIFGSEPK